MNTTRKNYIYVLLQLKNYINMLITIRSFVSMRRKDHKYTVALKFHYGIHRRRFRGYIWRGVGPKWCGFPHSLLRWSWMRLVSLVGQPLFTLSDTCVSIFVPSNFLPLKGGLSTNTKMFHHVANTMWSIPQNLAKIHVGFTDEVGNVLDSGFSSVALLKLRGYRDV